MRLISEGKSFQSFGAEATKARSPRVVKVLKFGWDSSIPLLDRSPYLELVTLQNGSYLWVIDRQQAS